MTTEKFLTLFNFAPKSSIKAGDGLEEGTFPFYTSSSTVKRIEKALYFENSLIFGTGGRANIHFADTPFSTSTDCLVAIPRANNFNIKFVYYYLSSNLHLLEQGFKGAGLKHISRTHIEDLNIPIFSADAQNKIVLILDKALGLLSKRTETIRLFDNLLKSVFLKQFGSLLGTTTLENLTELGGLVLEGDKINYGVVQPGDDFPNGVPVVRVGDFEDYFINISSLKRIDPKINQKHKASILVGGEVLLVCVGATIGKVAIVENSLQGYNIVRATARINCGAKLRNTYLVNLLLTDYYQHQLKLLSRTVAQPTLNIQQIEELKVPVPSLEEQMIFENIFYNLVKRKRKAKESLEELENLFGSISQKAFNGQLNFNIDFELDALIREIDIQKMENDITKIVGDVSYLQRLVDKLNTQEFKEKALYDRAKHAAFQIMTAKEENRKVIQVYNNNNKTIGLALK